MFEFFTSLADVQAEYDRRLREAETERQFAKPRAGGPGPLSAFLASLVAFAAALGFYSR